VAKLGSTIRINNEVKDFDGNLVNPDVGSQEVKIYDGEGLLKKTITDAEISQEDLGKFYVDYIIENSPDGYWKAVWKVEVNSKPDIEAIKFLVEVA